MPVSSSGLKMLGRPPVLMSWSTSSNMRLQGRPMSTSSRHTGLRGAGVRVREGAARYVQQGREGKRGQTAVIDAPSDGIWFRVVRA